MTRLTEEMVIARSKQSDLGLIKKLNCWGSDLSDVTIIKKMRGVEVLALSVNKISTLQPFEDCLKLEELYLRKNNIVDINEIVYLQNLPVLKYLWLEENPCCDKAGANYRAIILRALPNLKKLDNVEVTQEEVDDALRRSGGSTTQEDDNFEEAYEVQHQQLQYEQQQQLQYQQQQQPSHYQQPQRTQPQQHQQQHQQQAQQQAQYSSTSQQYLAQQRRSSSPQKEEYYQSDRPAYPVHYRHSQTDLTEWEEHQHNPYSSNAALHHTQRRNAGAERDDRYACRNGNARENGDWEEAERPRTRRPDGRFSDSASTVSTAVLNHYSGFHRRPINRSSNLLSATLCLVKELDYSSLEVVEHAVRCRIDELSAE